MITILSLTNPTSSLARLASLIAAVLAFAMGSVANAQQPFKTAEEAVDALVRAAKTDDRKGILTVLGRDGADIVSAQSRYRGLRRQASGGDGGHG
jgi:Protein of unknown function (DUF2950)